MEYSAITDVGLVRTKNQDSYITIENKYGDLLALVADGIGGGKAGEVASFETIKYFENAFKESGPFSDYKSVINYLSYHVNLANKHVHELSEYNEDYRGMGTTLTGIIIANNEVVTINVGDSRVYGFVDKSAYTLTKDDTLVNQMIESGQIKAEEAINHPKKHYLVKAIGIFDKVKADVHKVKNMDYYLCCSDGLHGLISSEEMVEIIYDDSKSLHKKCLDLNNLAMLKGGYDNITAVLVKM